MDRRRARWFAMDVHFFDGNLCHALLDQFGPAGVCVFVAFLAACKRNSVPGRMSYGSHEDAMNVMGLFGLRLVNPNGEPWTLDDLWTLCGRHKVTTRQRRNHLTYVVCTKWADWQKDATRGEPERDQTSTTPKPRTKKGRSAGSNTTLDKTSTSTATGPSSPGTNPPQGNGQGSRLTPKTEQLAARLAAACHGDNAEFIKREAEDVVAHLARFVSYVVIEKAIGNAEKRTDDPIILPRAIVSGISRDMHKLSIVVPPMIFRQAAS